jgi:hypothetical protein
MWYMKSAATFVAMSFHVIDAVRQNAMTIYVADIKGRGIAAFYANDDSDAETRARDCAFRDDLMVLATGGLSLWDGVADIRVRPALSNEAARWQVSQARAIRQGNIDGTDDTWVAFLVPLTDPDRRET